MMFRKSLTALTQVALVSRVHGLTAAVPKTSRQIPLVATFATRESQVASTKIASEELLELMNSQVTNELEASQLYLSASIWCQSQDLEGMAAFMRAESSEEREHAMGFIDYAKKRDFPISLQGLEAPKSDWRSVQELWEHLLEAEQQNTEALLELADVASESSDHATSAFLMPYHTEQVESEDNLKKIIAKVRDEKQTPGLLRQLDSSLEQQASAN